ncbi:unnamed protein product, partial [Darwinula stevensoni]
DRLGTFASNHAAANAYGQDIRSIATDVLDDENPRPYVIVGGPPCQGFSSIRPFRNVDWADPRNNLAEEFCRIVNDLRPEWVVFENVVGLLTHEKGKSARAIQEAFEEIGYRTDARVLNSAYYGVPQRRERLIIVGSLRNKRFKWPTPTHQIDARSMVGDSNLIIKPEKRAGACLPRAVTLDEALHDLPELQSGEASNLYRDNVHPTDRLAGDEPSVTLTVNFVHPASNRCIHPHQDRALTPREGARIQGFFDTFNFVGSRAQVVKQIGNAVSPILGKKIAEAIIESD